MYLNVSQDEVHVASAILENLEPTEQKPNQNTFRKTLADLCLRGVGTEDVGAGGKLSGSNESTFVAYDIYIVYIVYCYLTRLTSQDVPCHELPNSD